MKCIILQRPWNEEREKILGIFLFHDDEIERKKEILYNMWLKRKRILKHIAELLMEKLLMLIGFLYFFCYCCSREHISVRSAVEIKVKI